MTQVTYGIIDPSTGKISSSGDAKTWVYHAGNERVTVYLPVAIAKGTELLLNFVYSGVQNSNMVGLYNSSYVSDAGATQYLVATQFEATYARLAFPCFDEPAFKANFTVTVDGIPPGYTALSNMPIDGPATPSRWRAGTTMQSFLPSPRMSSYLVAVVVAPLVSQASSFQSTAGHTVAVTVYAVSRAENVYKLEYPLQQGIKAIQDYERLFAPVAYPLPSLAFVALPDFAAGAMENWGLVTFRESTLLGNRSISTALELSRITVVVSHELAHMTFGDLVTMDSFAALFLNEGGARLFEYLATDDIEPGFGIMSQFASLENAVAMRATSYANSRSLVNPVASSAEIQAQFDAVSYSYGASLLAMLKGFLERRNPGANLFFSTMTAYFQKFAYSNASPADLWASFATTSGISTLPDYLNSYTHQKGVPIVSIEWTDPSFEKTGIGVLKVSQRRFFTSDYSKALAPAGEQAYLWWIPLTLVGEVPSSPANEAAVVAMNSNGFTTQTWSTTIGHPSNPYSVSQHGWVKANLNGTGLYRVNYPKSLWQRLSQGIVQQHAGTAASTAPVLSPADRAQLLDDLLTIAEGSSFVSTGIDSVLALQWAGSWLPLENSYEVWAAVASHLTTMNLRLSPDPSEEANMACRFAYSSFVQRLLAPMVQYVGFNDPAGDSPLRVQLRTTILSAASVFNVSSVVNQARVLYAEGIETVSVNLQAIVAATVIRWSTDGSEYIAIRSLYEQATDSNVQRRYLLALAATSDPALLQATLQYALGPAVRSQDSPSLIAAVAANPAGRAIAWQFVKDNWDTIHGRYGRGGSLLTNIVFGTAAGFHTVAMASDIEHFYYQHPAPAAFLNWNQALEGIQAGATWRSLQFASTCSYLGTQL
jgi:aminopeptidase N